ncbi:MAG: type II toxin-antitoxin system RelE/ParE family toxin [Gammaproteobacteria bacterium]|nr:type II toxin-antitoxin system RelE/ParE family toxin [Gammaproteobacteria bacterium]
MIKTIKHKGLGRFYNTGTLSGIQAHHARRLQLILTRLDASVNPEDMDLPGLHLHQLKGQLKGFYSVTVQSNWRIVFRFDGDNACDVDYVDYH